MSLFVGVDGGGTASRVLVVGADGQALGRARGGPGLIDPLAPERTVETVASVVREAVEAAGGRLPVVGLWAGLAGGGVETRRIAVEERLAATGLAGRVAVGTDLEAAAVDAFPEGPGILVVAGTGSIAWGRGPTGVERRIGGWGAHIGDEGSGYAIGLAALRRVLHASDGRGPETDLTEALLSQLEVGETGALVEWSQRATKADIASLTPTVARVAGVGDGVAAEVLGDAVRDLVGHVVGLRDALGPWATPPSCALAGGLLAPGGSLRERCAAALRKAGVRPLDAEVRPERGAARRALALGD